jgi:hypothetical protein
MAYGEANYMNMDSQTTDVKLSSYGIRSKDADNDGNNIECKLVNDTLYIYFNNSEGTAYIYITSMETGLVVTTSMFDTTSQYIYDMSGSKGEYKIQVETTCGGCYVGYISMP